MSLPRFFLKDQALSSETEQSFRLKLDEGDLNHARALRLKVGERIAVVDSAQDYFECEVIGFDGTELLVSISAGLDAAELPDITLVQCMGKGHKVDDVIRATVEMGAREIWPVISDRSVVRLDAAKAKSRRERLQAIAKSASMQSGRPDIPAIRTPCEMRDIYDDLLDFDVVLFFWEGAAQSTEASIEDAIAVASAQTDRLASELSCAVLVGPEGGFSDEEASRLQSLPNARACTLGPLILRTETAGCVAFALASYFLGGLGARG